MAKKYEVWVGGRMIGKRTSESRDYTHAIIGQTVKTWDPPPPPDNRDEASYQAINKWRELRRAVELGHWEVLSFAGSHKLALDRLNEFKGGAYRNVTAAPVTEVAQWTKIDFDGLPYKTLLQAAEEFLSFFADYVGGPAWGELNGENGEDVPPSLAAFKNTIEREKKRDEERAAAAESQAKLKADIAASNLAARAAESNI